MPDLPSNTHSGIRVRVPIISALVFSALEPIDGVCVETSAAFSVFLATHLGIPVSTTHVITGAISGVGSAIRFTAVRWGVTVRIVWAWIFTIPTAALLAGFIYFLFGIFDLK
jgi:PiT family inorganic phosphate transporter